MKYSVHPDFVVSKTDRDVHYITAKHLMHLYQVDPRECVVIDDASDRRSYANLMRLAEEDKLIPLRPRFDGNYALPSNDPKFTASGLSVNPWVPMTNLLDLKHIGKLIEELGECVSAAARCQIQGIDEREPTTGKLNREWLEDEIADVTNNLQLVTEHFNLDVVKIRTRVSKKRAMLKEWHGMLEGA